MDGRKVLWMIVVMAVLVSGCGLQPDTGAAGVTRRVGVLVGTDFRLSKVEGLMDSLPAYGYVPGDNMELIVKNAKGDHDQLLPLAEELVDAGVEVIMTAGRVETEAAKKAVKLTGIPIVFMGLTGLKEDGLVKDLLHPKEGLTGVHNDHAALSGKRLELLVKLLPEIEKVLVLYDPHVIPTREGLPATREAAAKIGIEIVEAAVATPEDIQAVLEQVGHEVQGILLLPSVFLESAGARALAPLALALGLPVMGVEYTEEEHGLFAIYGITPYDQGYQSARILAKILSGQTTRDIPVEPPSTLRLTVNMEVAEQLNLTPDPVMLGYADLEYGEGGRTLDP